MEAVSFQGKLPLNSIRLPSEILTTLIPFPYASSSKAMLSIYGKHPSSFLVLELLLPLASLEHFSFGNT